MKKSELFAQYTNFGKDIITIEPREFFEVMQENIVELPVSRYTVESTDVMHWDIDGWRYFSYHSTWNVGWEGDVNSDSYYCKIACLTSDESKKIMSIVNKF